MTARDALPPKGVKLTCAVCGLSAPAPIVVRNDVSAARCSNRKACEHRKRRADNKRKEATS